MVEPVGAGDDVQSAAEQLAALPHATASFNLIASWPFCRHDILIVGIKDQQISIPASFL